MADATADIKIVVKDVQGVVRSIDRIEKKLASMGKSSQAASRRMIESNKQATASFDNISKSFGKFARGLGIITAASFAAAVAIREMSKIQTIQIQLKAVSDSAADYAHNLELVQAVSLETGTSFKENATLLSRYTRALERFGGSADHAAVVIDTLNKAFLINGTTGSEATSVLIQLSQALTAGALSGDEFRSFAENAGSLVDELAKTMGVSVTQLKKLGAEGKITADKVVETAIRMNKEFSKMFEKTGELPLLQALQNIVTQFEYAATKSEAFNDVMSALGGFLIRVADLFLQFIQVFESMSLANATTEVAGAASAWEILGEFIYQTTNILLTAVKIIARGMQAGVKVIQYLIDTIKRTFEVAIDDLAYFGQFAISTWENIKEKLNRPFSFDYSANQQKAIDAFKAGTKKLGVEADKIKQIEFDALVSDLSRIGLDIWGDIRQGVANAFGENKGLANSILEGIRENLKKLNTPALKGDIDKAAKKLADDFAKALREATADAKEATISLSLLDAGGSEEQLQILKDTLSINKEIDEWRFKGVGKDALESLRTQLTLTSDTNREIEKSVTLLREKLSVENEIASTAQENAVKQFQIANFTLTKTQEQLDYETEVFAIRQKQTEKALRIGPALAASWAEGEIAALSYNKVISDNAEKQQQMIQLSEGLASAFGSFASSLISNSASMGEAMRQLTAEVAKLIIQLLILEAFKSAFPGFNGTAGSGLPGTQSGAPKIRIYNYGSAPGGIQTRQNPNGQVDVIIGQMASAINRGGNPFDQALRRTYGLGRVGS